MALISVTLPPSLVQQLRSKGVTADRAGEILGCGPRQAAHLLRKAGATRGTSNCRWHMGPGK